MPKHNPDKKPVILPVVVTEGANDTPVGRGIFIGEATTDPSDPSGQTQLLDGMAFLDVPPGGEQLRQEAKAEYNPAGEVINDQPKGSNSSSYGYDPRYAQGYDNIDWGKVTKN